MIAASLIFTAALPLLAPGDPASVFWIQEQKLLSSDPAASEAFGSTVAIWGDTILVGEPWDQYSSGAPGAVHVYVYDGATWNHQAKLTARDTGIAQFGYALAFEGNRALIGTNSNLAYLFERTGTAWSQVKEFRAGDTTAPPHSGFGSAVALSGRVALMGAYNDTPSAAYSSGSAYVFEWNGEDWFQTTKVFPSAPTENGQFGQAVALSGDRLLVGDPYDEDLGLYAGSAFVFDRLGDSWVQTSELHASDGYALDHFGEHLALSGDTAVVAVPDNVLAPGAVGGFDAEGAVYVFERDFGGPDAWGEALRLTASDPQTPWGFGTAVALDGDRLLIGAPSNRGAGADAVEALAFAANTGRLYATDTAADVLLVIDPGTGMAFPVGLLGFDHVVGLAFDPVSNTLYGVDDVLDVLLTIDTGTGAAVSVGSLGFDEVEGLAFDAANGILYGSDAASDQLIAIDTVTGAGTAIGSFGFSSANQDVDGLAIDPATGTLYGTRSPLTPPDHHRLVTIDPLTGMGSVVGSTGMTNVVGLAVVSAVGLLGAKGPADLLVELDTSTGVGTVIGPMSSLVQRTGAAYVFERDAGGPGAWGQVARLTSPDSEDGDLFGTYAVAGWGDTVVAGALGDDAGGLAAGSAYALRLAASAPTYCTAGTSAAGCQATLSGTGSPSATAISGFRVAAAGVEGRKAGILFFGANGRQANPWGNGSSFQCVVPPVMRGGLLPGSGTIGTCDGAFLQDLNALWCPICPHPNFNPGAGAIVQAQLWYRDPQNTSNQTTSLSDALEFPVGP